MADNDSKSTGCFFSEAAFLRVMGPVPSLQERLNAIASRPKAEEVRKKMKVDIDRSIFDSLPLPVVLKGSQKGKKGKRQIKGETSSEIDNTVVSVGEEQDCEMPDSQMACGKTADTNSLENTTITPESTEDLASKHMLNSEASDNQNVQQLPKETVSICNDNCTTEKEINVHVNSNQKGSLEEPGKSFQASEVQDGKPKETDGRLKECLDISETSTQHQDKDNRKDVSDPCSKVVDDASVALPSLNASIESDVKGDEKKDEDVCCLVMPNDSEDDSGDEDAKDTEEPFCLVMPSISSDEMSSKEDVDIYATSPLKQMRGSLLGGPVQGMTSTRVAADFEVPDDPAPIMPVPNQPTVPVEQKVSDSPHMGASAMQTVASLTTSLVSNEGSQPVEGLKEQVQCAETTDGTNKGIQQLSQQAQTFPVAGPSTQNGDDKTRAQVFPVAGPSTQNVDDKTRAQTFPVAGPSTQNGDDKTRAQTFPVAGPSTQNGDDKTRAQTFPVAGPSTQNRDDKTRAQAFPVAGPSTQNVDHKTKEPPKFFQNCRSKLSKKQHKRYIQLYKRHVCPMMKGNKKTSYTAAELTELVELEELQQHASHEQAEYQEYLKNKAQRNPNAYNFLTQIGRMYTQSRYISYHRPRNYIRNYDIEQLFTVPLVLEDKSAFCFMTFQKTLLKLGNSARITIPDVKDGMNPVQVRPDASAINAWFPSSNRNIMEKTMSMDHKMVSEDNNAVKLTEEEDIDIVMSSSSFKCLLDNHGSNVMRPWDIPVTVRRNPYGGRSAVYLDKPLHRDDVLMRDFNAMYHKYALRTFVSRPRDKGITRIQANTSNSKPKMASRLENSRFSSDDFDIFSTGAVDDNIETFGSFSSTAAPPRLSFDKPLNVSVPSERDKGSAEDNVCPEANNDGDNTTPAGQVRRSARRSQSNNTQDCSVDANATNSTSVENEQSGGTKCLRRSTRLFVSVEPKLGTNSPCSPNKKQDTEPPVKVAKTDDGMVETETSSQQQSSSTNEPKRKRGRPKLDRSSSEGPPDISPPSSKINVLDHSPKTKESTSELPLSSESPASPPAPGIHSPVKQDKEKVMAQTPVEVPLSPVRGSTPSCPEKRAPSLLDSILGPCDDRPQTSLDGNVSHVTNAPEDSDKSGDFQPVCEKCNHIIYNQWEMGPMKLLIRCNYHGAIKDKGKPRYVYISPKMEYQPDSGMEQVTLNEMTRTWASCFIRPGTNLIRARMHAFTSELLMVEEKSIDGILNPSLPFKPDHSFAVLRQIFEQLQRLPEGQYLLSHLKGDKFCRVRKFTGKACVLPAPKKKKTGRAKEGQVPWIPIDPTILTPSHIHNARIPGTFMPSDWELSKNPHGGSNKQPNQGWKGANKNNKRDQGGQWNNQNQNQDQNK